MSIGAIGGGSAYMGYSDRAVHGATGTPTPQNDTPDIPAQQPKNDTGTEQNKPADITGGGSSPAHSINTKDFLALRAQAGDETYEVLDKVIAEMKENIEEAGEMIETMSKIMKKASKSSIALQVLQKTFEAIDEMTGDKNNGNSCGFSSIA